MKLAPATNSDLQAKQLESICKRIYNLARMISVCSGLSGRDDTLPYRTTDEPIPEGPTKGRCCRQEREKTFRT